MTDCISGTPFSLQFVLAKLQEAGVNNGCVQQNLVSFDVKLTLHWNSDKIEPKSLILKVPGVSNASKLFMEVSDSNTEDEKTKKAEDEHPASLEDILVEAHDREIMFYQFFSPYNKILKLPKFYYGFEFSEKHSDGLIIMEDLTPRAITIKMLPGLNDDQVLSMICELARIHTVSWKHPECMAQIVNPERSQEFMNFKKTITGSLKQMKPEWFAEVVDQLLPIFITDTLENVVYDTDHFGFPPTAVHGDLWAPNILWKKDENGEATSEVAAVIDWQMVHAGNPCEDIARLLSFNTTGAYRRANTLRLLKHYTDKVTEFMDGKALFTFQTIVQAYEAAMPYVATNTGFGAPMYYNMASVVGEGQEKAANQLELLSRVHMFFQDTLTVLDKRNRTQ